MKLTVTYPPPDTGWDDGKYEFCARVLPAGCPELSKKCCDNRAGDYDRADLVITDVWNVENTIYYMIKNNGDKIAGASSTSLTVDDVFEASDSVASLGTGVERTESFSYTWNCAGTDDMIKVCADYMEDVAESSESNNCRTETWTHPLPDLMITDVWADNSTIYYKIKNEGDRTAGTSSTSLTVDDVFKASDSVASLDHGVARTESFSYTWNCTNTDDTIKVCADYTGDVAESSESNNCRTETLMGNPPDIRISPASFDVELPPDIVSNYTLTIGNNGTGVLDFIIGDIETQAASARATSLGMVSNDISNSTNVLRYGHDTAGNVKDSSNFSEGERRTSIDITSTNETGIMGVDVSSIPSQIGWPKTIGGEAAYSSPALGDIDGDGDIEVVIGSCDVNGVYNNVHAWHHNGSIVSGWPKRTGDWVQSSPALGDIDGDGDIEVVVGSADKKVYAWHHDGSIVAGWPKMAGYWVSASPALGDIDGDGDMEVVVGSNDKKVHAWHHDGSIVSGWPTTGTGGGVGSPALGDIDGDGDIEVVSGSRDEKVYAWHHDGSIVSGWPTTGIVTASALGDIDGDGDIEVVGGSYAWHHDGSIVSGWPIKTAGPVMSSPALGDIDGDGDIEVVVGSQCGKVYAWDCSGTYDPDNIEWGMFRHDARHTGLYEKKPPKKEEWLSEYPTTGTVDPDSQTDITVTFNTAGLPFGNYTANITIASNDPDENPVIIPVQLTVTSTPAQKGDLNGDNQITPADAAIALQIAATGAQNPAADVNDDGRITSIDALMILQAAAGRIELWLGESC